MKRSQHLAYVLLAVATVLSWKAIESWSQVEQTRVRTDGQLLRAKETTKQMQLMYEASRGGKVPLNMPPPPELAVPAAPALTEAEQ